jgi:hypothetical protein
MGLPEAVADFLSGALAPRSQVSRNAILMDVDGYILGDPGAPWPSW